MIKSFWYDNCSCLFIFLLAWTLVGCDHVKRGLGLDRHQADEFNVIERHPLSMPPSTALNPPIAENSTAKSKASRQAVQNLVVKPPASAPAPLSLLKSEQDLLTKLDANKSDKHGTNIRNLVDQESNVKSKREPGLAEDMVFWKDPKPEGDVIDPMVEKKRLEPNLSSSSKKSKSDD